MITKSNKIKCDNCGRFISYQDLVDKKAINIMILPDSQFSVETYKSLCKDCNNE